MYNFEVSKLYILFNIIFISFISLAREWFIHLHTFMRFLCTNIFLGLFQVRVRRSGNKRPSLRLCLPGFLGVIRIGWRTTIKVKYWPSWRERAVGISFAGGLNSDHRSHSCELLIAVWLAGSLTPQIEAGYPQGWLTRRSLSHSLSTNVVPWPQNLVINNPTGLGWCYRLMRITINLMAFFRDQARLTLYPSRECE